MLILKEQKGKENVLLSCRDGCTVEWKEPDITDVEMNIRLFASHIPELDGYKPPNGAVHPDDCTYLWYKLRNNRDIDAINKKYELDIPYSWKGEMLCIEELDGDAFETTFSACLKYIKDFTDIALRYKEENKNG